MDRYGRADGVLVEAVGHLWAAFSPLSGETTLLNDESAAILEVLELGGNDTWGVCAALAEDGGLDVQQLVTAVAGSWMRLLDAGLVTRLSDAAAADS